MELAIIISVVVVALVFDYTNGFHDAANAIATSVSTRALTPRVALGLAAVMNFIGAFLGQKVAKTVSEVISFPDDMLTTNASHALVVVMAGLIGAITWNMITWYYGLPSSSSHALIGGLVGAALAAGVTVEWDTVMEKVILPMLVSPVFAFGVGFAVMLAIMWIFRRVNPHKANRGFKLAQTASAAAMALGHGLQDAQKTMGVIFLALLAGGYVGAGDDLPLWVIFAAAAAISAGTWAGGWRIMRTLGRRIIHLDPARGFAAESVAASVLYTTAYAFEAPISTTHTITSAVMGVGATKRFSAVRWGVARSIVVAWVSTFPAAGAVAAFVYLVCRYVFQLP
ncbi:inorganic phosphate transporter [Nocardioides marmotae]|uniref:Inorganic phosphate transporter n=1 Tax=Nocardioides marmotae TaxID=2663857 RepID=A0A6I3JCN9_9ACTN|nr:inorganic phosphate transporter [Nocardioides marmotae]MCR6032157.1 inorganic phosphate transporter [Gordonia jinghuaiqii]MBC9735376.1 inorganic phosphate transporter [Nocardioides marmotae]MTB86475.1 inorganic phosphate transporter [Nocardioides marmotae]MTB95803.1 inorganic phosphate transporter [Nocardioides marmotae]QKE02842.1 inorganic phosphate transporter [Nocardioides marmotae]